MQPIDSNHDMNFKTLLDGAVLQGGQGAMTDMNAATDIVFKHANTGPFITKQLIQHLVKSNPSPAYVSRVAAVFNDNRSQVKGDLKAVVRAILLDPEARAGDSAPPTISDGHMQEPMVFIASALRHLNGTTDGLSLIWWSQEMGEDPLQPPSVFSFFPPDYPLQGTGLLGPEFALCNTATIEARSNFLNQLLFSTVPWGTSVNVLPYDLIAGNSDALLLQLNNDVMHDTMPAALQGEIAAAVNAIPVANQGERARQALYLLMNSNEYQIRQ